MELNEIFAHNFAKFLTRRGLSQVEIADKLNVSGATISYWLKGQKTPRMNKVAQLANILDVSISALTEENGFEDYENQFPANVIPMSALQRKKIPLLGSVAAGEPIFDEEFPDVFAESPVDADFAVKVKGDSMEPTFYEDDIVFVRACPDLAHDGALCVISIDNDACIKHVSKAETGIIITSDNPDYPSKLITAAQHVFRILGTPIGFTRIFKTKKSHRL